MFHAYIVNPALYSTHYTIVTFSCYIGIPNKAMLENYHIARKFGEGFNGNYHNYVMFTTIYYGLLGGHLRMGALLVCFMNCPPNSN